MKSHYLKDREKRKAIIEQLVREFYEPMLGFINWTFVFTRHPEWEAQLGLGLDNDPKHINSRSVHAYIMIFIHKLTKEGVFKGPVRYRSWKKLMHPGKEHAKSRS